MEKEDLDNIIETKVKPMIDEIMKKSIGITIKELSEDISDRVMENPLLDFIPDTSLSLKSARNLFRKHYIEKLLTCHYGDVTAVGRILGVDRRSVHRMVKELGINISKCRKAMLKPEYIKKEAVSTAIGHVMKDYEEAVHPSKVRRLYKSASDITDSLLKELPFKFLTLKESDGFFERKFMKQLLEEVKWNLSKAAKRLGIRYETLIRKMKKLGVEKS